MEHELSESNSNTEVLKTAMESEKVDFEQQMETLRALNSELNSRVEQSEQDKLTLTSTINVSFILSFRLITEGATIFLLFV